MLIEVPEQIRKESPLTFASNLQQTTESFELNFFFVNETLALEFIGVINEKVSELKLNPPIFWIGSINELHSIVNELGILVIYKSSVEVLPNEVPLAPIGLISPAT